jgi:FtsZ-binding cell division protein ZapB
MNAVEVLGLIGLIISIPIAVGAGLALVRSSYNKARLEESDRDNERFRTRNGDLIKERDQLRVENDYLKEKNAILQEMVTQRAELEAHRTMVAKNHKIIMGQLERLLGAVDRVIEYVHPRS